MRTSVEAARGCGYRQPGGLYLVAPELTEPCPRLPIMVEHCPTCGQGIKPARGWTWIDPRQMVPASVHGSTDHNANCPLGLSPVLDGGEWRDVISMSYHRTGERAGLIWIGEAFYKTPGDFMREAVAMGISRRIAAVPRGFTVGETWVYLGHRKGFLQPGTNDDGTVDWNGERYVPGIVTLFRPTAVEYVLKDGEEDDAELLASLEERGIEPVKVIREGGPLVETDDPEAGDLDE